MKKVAILLAFIMLFMVGCGGAHDTPKVNPDSISANSDIMFTAEPPHYTTENGSFEWDNQFAAINKNGFPQQGADEAISWLYAYYTKPTYQQVVELEQNNIENVENYTKATEIMGSYFGFGITGYIYIDERPFLVLDLETDAMYNSNYASLPLYYVAVSVDSGEIAIYETNSMYDLTFNCTTD